MNALVVGYGHMGRIHASVLRDLGLEVVTVDPREEAGADYATVADAAMGTGPDPLIPPGRHTFQVAAIAVPHDALVDTAFSLVGTPMLVEKPFASSAQEAAMLGAFLERSAPVVVDYVERFNPRVAWLRKELLERGATHINAVHFVRHSPRATHDEERDLLTHDVDLMMYLHLHAERISFDVQSDAPTKERRIVVDAQRPARSEANGRVEGFRVVADLMDHTLSPLHALWHEFLLTLLLAKDKLPEGCGSRLARPRDAISVLEVVESDWLRALMEEAKT